MLDPFKPYVPEVDLGLIAVQDKISKRMYAQKRDSVD